MVFEGRLPSRSWGTSSSAHPFAAHFAAALAKCQRFRLGKDIRHQQVVMIAQSVQCSAKTDEITRDQLGALVNQLVERMLPVGARLAQ